MTDLALTRRTATLGLTAVAFTGLARSGWATARDSGACEDQYTETVANRLIGVTPAGQTYVLGFLRAQTELTGACFSPDGRTLYVNCYSPARTLAIIMPTRAGA